jgi:diguanylate cyclase (GGDEF)-like protein/PAS domain S-box-containing protein
VAGASDVTVVLGDNLVVRWQSPAGPRRFGLPDDEVVGRRFTDLLHPDDAAAVADRLRAVTAGPPDPAGGTPPLLEARILDGFGRYRETESTVSDLRDAPEVAALVLNIRDVGERRRLERAVARLTSTDQLTGLPNRREVVRAVAGRRRGGRRPGALIVIELLDLAGINDRYGSRVGDAVLVEAALRLRTHAGAEDVVGRLAGGRYAAVTADGPIEAYALGVRLLTVLSEPYQLPEDLLRLQAGAGLAELAAGSDAEDVLRRAELALHRAVAQGHNRIEWYDDSLEQALVRRTDLEQFLPGAIGRGELDLAYQPVVELPQARPTGVEALLRWRHPVLGTVYPAELLPVAEKLGMGREIAAWLLHNACQQVSRWRRDGVDLWLSLDVSPGQVTDGEFVPEVAAALSVHQTPPERLAVEICEAELGEEIGVVARALGRLRALGVRTGLDDFHGGRTTLDQLRRLPLDYLKIPSSVNEADHPVLAAGVDVAGRLGLEVVAEGVADDEQLRRVRMAGCRYAQGNLFSPPAPAERVEAYLDGYRAPSS